MKKSIGVGDTIEKITTVTGIKSVVHFLFGDDCGCDERKEKLNKMFPYYSKIECLTEDEYNYLTKFNFYTNVLEPIDQKQLLIIHNRVFNQNRTATNCVACWKEIIEKLKKVYEEYKVTE